MKVLNPACLLLSLFAVSTSAKSWSASPALAAPGENSVAESASAVQSTSVMRTSPKPESYPGERTFWLGGTIRRFDYLEGDNAGDGELGTMPGFSLGFSAHPYRDAWFADLSFDGVISQTQYFGSNLKKTIAVTNDTVTRIFDFEGDIGLKLLQADAGPVLGAYTGMGLHYWRRGQHAIVNGVHTYREDYSWLVFPVGFKFDLNPYGRWNIGLDTSARLSTGGSMKAYFSEINPNIKDPEFKLGPKVGFKVMVPVSFLITQNWGLGITPWGEYSAIGTSDAVALEGQEGQQVVDQNGNPEMFHEPSSRTFQYGSTIAVRVGI